MFTFHVFWGSLGTINFGNSSSAANNTRSRLPSRLSFRFLWLWSLLLVLYLTYFVHVHNILAFYKLFLSIFCFWWFSDLLLKPDHDLYQQSRFITITSEYCRISKKLINIKFRHKVIKVEHFSTNRSSQMINNSA